MSLTDRQRRFVEEYVAGGNGAKAAKAAGYKDGPGIYETASTLLRKPEIREAVDARQADLANQLGYTRQWVLERLEEVRAMAVAEEKPQLTAANRALELIGKAHGMWVDRATVDMGGTVVYTLDLGGGGVEDVDDGPEG
jgi:phage terminase small subunit